ncbi:MAG: helix-turn-helix transcriptional regulator [Bdellovibrionaceae bacterium]|nr:helix-turn-helix transcriptional regulator [Pseudobdellovibrionaceae bacterium]
MPKSIDRGDYFKTVGLCQKDLSGRVEIQNELCLKLCGWRIGQVCKDGCMKSPTLHKPKRVIVKDLVASTILLRSGDKLITVITENDAPRTKTEPLPRHSKLSPSEENVVRLAETGMSNREMADHLCLSLSTVKSHINAARKKLGSKEWDRRFSTSTTTYRRVGRHSNLKR